MPARFDKRSSWDPTESLGMGLLILAVAAVVMLGGCSEQSAAAPVDPQRAHDALKTTLDAWRAARPIDELSRANPSIIAQDFDWMAGKRLLDYEIAPNDEHHDLHLKIRVTLKVEEQPGRIRTIPVVYVVGTSPQVTVFRAFE